MSNLQITQWATNLDCNHNHQYLSVETGPYPTPMAHSNATGQGLVSNGQLGADLIRLKANDGFVPHTHPGDHLLIVVGGKGTITYDGYIYPTQAGQVYMIAGEIPHAVGAITDHVILAVGSPHKSIDSPDRMAPVEYQAVVAEVGDLHCLICDNKATYPQMLHDVGCEHCPCELCNPYQG
ncbi:MAG: cupin domain-containing protein [Chloroflexota bacterium]